MTDQNDPPGDSNEPVDPWDNFEPIDPFSELSDLSAADPLPPLEDPTLPPATPPRSPVLTGLIVALLLVVLTVAFFQFLRQDDNGTTTNTTIPAAQSTTTAAGTDTSTPTATTGGTDGVTDSTQPIVVAFDPYAASGEAVPLSDLTLAVDGIGPIDFGTPADTSVGRLVASLGEPDEDSGPVVSTGAYGSCTGENERIVRWGPFVAIVVIDPDGSETFAAYRLDLNLGDVSADTVNLETLSGLKAGFSVLQLEQIYSSFDLRYGVDDDIGAIFELYSSNTGNLLLWGPVTSDESTGVVLGIYSPDACGRF